MSYAEVIPEICGGLQCGLESDLCAEETELSLVR